MFKKGFTLIELLVVMGVLAVLAAGLVVAINPADKLKAANDAKVQSDISQIATAANAYATSKNGFYPANQTDLTGNGDLSSAVSAPTGYTAYAFALTPSPCTGGTTCTSIIVSGQLKSQKYTATQFWKWDSLAGKMCAAATAATACP